MEKIPKFYQLSWIKRGQRGERTHGGCQVVSVWVFTPRRMGKYLSLVCEGELLSEECKKKC